MADIVRDPRWEKEAPGVVSHVAVMGGVVELADGQIQMDPEANNNSYDLAAARFVYDTLRDDTRVWFLVVTRHAAAACQLPRTSFDGSAHPMARRLASVVRPSLQGLWERVHRTEIERMLAHDGTPMRCNPDWFRASFLEPNAPASLGKEDDVWPWVRGFMEYDGLTTVAAVRPMHRFQPLTPLTTPL